MTEKNHPTMATNELSTVLAHGESVLSKSQAPKFWPVGLPEPVTQRAGERTFHFNIGEIKDPEAFRRSISSIAVNATRIARKLTPPEFVRETEVTEEMFVAAAAPILREIGDPQKMGPGFSVRRFAARIYRAMHAAAPVPLVTEAEDAAHYAKTKALRLEVENTRLHDLVKTLTDQRDRRQADARAWAMRYAEKSAECNKLRAQLATVPDTPRPDPIANAIRARVTDRRRIGG